MAVHFIAFLISNALTFDAEHLKSTSSNQFFFKNMLRVKKTH